MPLIRLEAQETDTLQNVTVNAKQVQVAKKVVPVQTINKDELGKMNSLSVADAVKYFAGALVKDYGGIGGLKTVSVRSLGANHTAIVYDGVVVANGQNGLIDLGKFSLENINSISLSVSGPADILMPARSFNSGAVLQMQSDEIHDASKKFEYKAAYKTGSFGLVNPAIKLAYRPQEKWSASVSGELQKANGIFKFNSYEDASKTKDRTNSDVSAGRLEADVKYRAGDENELSIKGYYYSSDRGLPGAVILNNSDQTRERLWDKNFFVQGRWKRALSKKSSLLLSGKYDYNFNRYLNPDFFNSQGKLENAFYLKEYYASAAYLCAVNSFLSLSYSSDYFLNQLKRTDEFARDFTEPERQTFLNNIAAKVFFKRLEIQVNALSTITKETVKTGDVGRNVNKVTPAVAFTYQPIEKLPVRVRFFYKNAFRLPTFNDLYYTFIGNAALKPESSQQYNLGLTYQQTQKGQFSTVSLTADGYINDVRDKILAVPRQNLFQWTMQNIGKVRIKGIDVGLAASLKPIGKTAVTLRTSYTYQKAVDVTDPSSPLFNNQIPYTPEHSVATGLHISIRHLSFNYNLLASSIRYKLGENNYYNAVEGYAVEDISAGYQAEAKLCTIKVLFELNNMLNKQYEIIKYYPMPGTNYRVGIIVNNK